MKRDPLIALWQSSIDLPKRFNLDVDIDAQMKYAFMEFYEFTQAILENRSDDEIAGELADMVVTMLIAADKCGVPMEAVIEAFYATAAKNDAKNHETHEVRNKQIVRKETSPVQEYNRRHADIHRWYHDEYHKILQREDRSLALVEELRDERARRIVLLNMEFGIGDEQ